MARVFRDVELAKLTIPGPLDSDQLMVTRPGGVGRPSSLSEPAKAAAAGRVMVWSAPALGTGAKLRMFSIPGEGPLGLACQLIGSLPYAAGFTRTTDAPRPSALVGHGALLS